MTRLIRLLLSFLTILTSLYSCKLSKYNFGTYYSSRFTSIKITIKPDYTFTYKYQGHLSFDTSAGSYHINKDTVYFKYYYNNIDSLFAAYESKNIPIPTEMVLSYPPAQFRPAKYFWKGKYMYAIDIETGVIIKDIYLKRL